MGDTERFIDAAHALLGDRGLTRDPDIVAPWLTDWRGRYAGRALAMASPASTAEVAALVGLCARHRVALVPQGGNSGMSGGATPDASGSQLLLSLRRMTEIRIDAPSREAVCGAGAILQTLHEAAAEAGLRFPLTLGGKGSATVGGLVSTNAGGTQVLRHGSMRALVVGLEAVLADGSVLDCLTPLKKDNRGFALHQVLIGSEGTLGVVTAARLRLEPAIAARTAIWVGLETLTQARELLLYCQAREGAALEGFEVLPGHCLANVLAYLPDARAPLAGDHPWHALIELDAAADGAQSLPERTEAMLAGAFEQGLLRDAAVAQSEAQAEAMWRLRESISPAERAAGPAVQHDVSVPLADVPAFVDEAVAAVEARWAGARAVAFGHLGDGNVHFHVIAPAGSDPRAWQNGDGKAISRFVHDIVARRGGSISAEHGIGQLKRDELQRLGDPVALAVMRRIKEALDPAGILNPGKLL